MDPQRLRGLTGRKFRDWPNVFQVVMSRVRIHLNTSNLSIDDRERYAYNP